MAPLSFAQAVQTLCARAREQSALDEVAQGVFVSLCSPSGSRLGPKAQHKSFEVACAFAKESLDGDKDTYRRVKQALRRTWEVGCPPPVNKRVGIGVLGRTFEFDGEALRQRGGLLSNYASDDFCESFQAGRVHHLERLNLFALPETFVPVAAYIASGALPAHLTGAQRDAAGDLDQQVGIDPFVEAIREASEPERRRAAEAQQAAQRTARKKAQCAILEDFGVSAQPTALAAKWAHFTENVQVDDALAFGAGLSLHGWEKVAIDRMEKASRAHEAGEIRKAAKGSRTLTLTGSPGLPGAVRLDSVPDQVAALKKLQELEIRGFDCAALPAKWSATALRHLHLEGLRNLQRLPDLTSFTGLLRLTLDQLPITRLPKATTSLVHLQQLKVVCPNLSDWPAHLDAWTALTDLHLGTRGLPEDLGGLTSLRKLRLSASQPQLPSSVTGLTSLTRLDLLGWRALQGLPPDLGRLTSLAELDLGSCQSLSRLPDTLTALRGLATLDLKHSGVRERPPALTRKGLQIIGDPSPSLWQAWMG